MSGQYRCIVADPPWDHSDGTGYSYGVKFRPGEAAVARNPRYKTASNRGLPRSTTLPYSTMTVGEIATLPVSDLAAPNAHLYLWTTQRFLRDSFSVAEAWGFQVSCTLVWCKAPRGFMGGAYRSSTEFVQFCRRGSLPHKTQAPTRWFTWPRVGHKTASGKKSGGRSDIGHSAKPEAFLDLVEEVSPGPYLELFARRQRLGWDTWGDEALSHVEMPA